MNQPDPIETLQACLGDRYDEVIARACHAIVPGTDWRKPDPPLVGHSSMVAAIQRAATRRTVNLALAAVLPDLLDAARRGEEARS